MSVPDSRWSTVREALQRRAAVDLRALAAFRICLGAILLVDLLRRSANLVAFYTDAGVVPRAALATQAPTFRHVSLHALSGGVWWQVALFVVAGLAALAMLVGYRSTLATALSFALLVSLHARNPAILHGGDSLLRQLLLWGVFLPLGARWSVDAAHRDSDGVSATTGQTVANLATAGVLLQAFVVYGTNAVFKFRGDAWLRGVAVEHVFALSRHTTGVAAPLREVPLLLTVADYAWLALLLASPLLLVSTDWRRTALAATYASFHAGMVVFMELGIFPFVSMTALLPFVHGGVWDRLPTPAASLIAGLAGVLPDLRLPRGPTARTRPVARAFLAVLLVALVVVNALSVGIVATPAGAPENVADKGWDMFAPRPPAEDGYYVVPATLESGERVDALRQEPVSWEPPADVSDTYGNERWRKLLYQLEESPESKLRPHLAQYLCTRWNRHHDDQMQSLRLVYVTDPIDGSPGERISYGTYECRS